MTAAWKKLWRQVGRRGLFLAFLALLDVVYGYFILNPPAYTPPQLYPLLPMRAWAGLWLATGAVCTIGMFLRRQDRIAYALAALLLAGWGLHYLWLQHLGMPFAWVSAMIWLVFAGIVLVVASWPEEIIILPPESRREH